MSLRMGYGPDYAGAGGLGYVVRRCRACGYSAAPVRPQDDDYRNKCPECGSIMTSSIVDPEGRVMVFDEEVDA